MSNQPVIVTLNMIVKNESKIIVRLLDSVIEFIDNFCICDTGSTDETKEIIVEYFKAKGISGKIIEEPFKNFEYNRNFALNACSGMGTHILLLDADMILQTSPSFRKKEFIEFIAEKDSFILLQGNTDFYYGNIRIVRNDFKDIKYVGVTHEYVNIPNEAVKGGTIDKWLMFILDIGDGGAKEDKFIRDVRLLTEGIAEDPKNARYHFYL